MRILVACEESQAVTKELRKLGHEAYSCDIQMCTGGEPQWHLRVDVLELLKMRWDMIIAFPPCTHLAVSGASWFEEKRQDGRQREAIEFFCQFLYADCEKIAVENPVNIIGGDYVREHFPDLAEKYHLPIKPTQHIEPYLFGDGFEKNTALWLKGLPKLIPTKIVKPPKRAVFESGKTMPKWYADAWHLPKEERSKVRSKTFPGIAKAMAEQWAGNNVKPAYIQENLF